MGIKEAIKNFVNSAKMPSLQKKEPAIDSDLDLSNDNGDLVR